MSDPALGTAPWWLALATLLVNDHLLKGAAVVPGWVTGKVSDLAFLVVAPPLVATLFAVAPLRRRHARYRVRSVAWGLVAAGFVAINVSPAAASGVEGLAAGLGLGWSLTVDPTDLLALPMMLVAWRLRRGPTVAGPRSTETAPPVPERRRLPGGVRPAVALGSVACLASPGPPPTAAEMWQAEAGLVNDSEEPVDVRVRWVDGMVSCDPHLLDHLEGALAMDVFGDGRTYALPPGGFAPLDQTVAPVFDVDPTDVPDPTGDFWNACRRVALVAAPGLAPTAVVWGRSGGVRRFPVDGEPEASGIPTVRLRGGATFRELEVTFGDDIAVVPLAAAARRCTTGPALPAVWTQIAGTGGAPGEQAWGTLIGIETLGAGCRRLTVDHHQPAKAIIDLCLPSELPFPFDVGDLVEVTLGAGTAASVAPPTGTNRELTPFDSVMTLVRPRPGAERFRDEAPEVQLGLVRRLGGWTPVPVPASGPIRESVIVGRGNPVCRGHTTLCGARVRPLNASLSNTVPGGRDQLIHPDDPPVWRTATHTTDDGEERLFELGVALGRAEEVVVSRPGCTDGREWAVPTVEVAWVQTTTPAATDGGGGEDHDGEGDADEEKER